MPVKSLHKIRVRAMAPDDRKRAYRRDMLLAGVMVAAGLVMSGVSLAQLAARPHAQMAQATQPLQSTPGADSKPSAPAEPATTGTRPNAVSPEPARPDAEAQKSGAQPALPPAPAEKTAAPINAR
jgi:cytoskeletal protein RodZ